MTDPSHLLIAGGGPAALEGALAVQRLAGERVRITLLSDRDDFVYRPVAVAEPFGLGEPQRFSLAALAAERGFALRRARLRAVDAAGHRAVREDGEPLRVAFVWPRARPGAAYEPALLTALGLDARIGAPQRLRHGVADQQPVSARGRRTAAAV